MCTRDRATQLQRAFEAVRALRFDGRWEFILVDNGSQDDTWKIARRFAASAGFPCNIIYEPAAGLSRARNRGLSAAHGDVVVFTDDDCYPQNDWLSAVSKCFEDRKICFAGGRVLLYDDTDRRVTIQESETPVTLDAGSFIPVGLIHGANMAFRRKPLLEARGFDERLGAGTRFRSGEDTDALWRLSLAGYDGRYEPDIVVYHHHRRKTRAEEAALLRGYDRGYGSCMIKCVVDPRSRALYARQWYWTLRATTNPERFRQLFFAALFLLLHGPTPHRVLTHPAISLLEDEHRTHP